MDALKPGFYLLYGAFSIDADVVMISQIVNRHQFILLDEVVADLTKVNDEINKTATAS